MSAVTVYGTPVTPGRAQPTALNSMLSPDLGDSIARHREWGLEWMDLWRDVGTPGPVDELDVAGAAEAAALIADGGLRVYALSTRVLDDDVRKGEDELRRHLPRLERILRSARELDPVVVRLIAVGLSGRDRSSSATEVLRRDYPWVRSVYREAIDRIHAAGFAATIENEVGDCVLSRPDEFLEFFDWLGVTERVGLTWDIQNNWETGEFPTLGVYAALKPLIGYVHVKGGASGPDGTTLATATTLADASWPVEDIVQAVVDDGISPVICLNPSHGAGNPLGAGGHSQRDLAAEALRDVRFLRERIRGVER